MARGSANNMVGSKTQARKSSQVKENEVKKVPSSVPKEPNKKRTKYDSSENKNDVKKITSKSSENEIAVKVESVKTTSRKTRNLRVAVGKAKLYDSQKKEYTKLKGSKMAVNLKKSLARGKEAIKNSESQSFTIPKNTINTKVNVRKTRNAKKVIDTKNIEINNQTDKIKDLITEPLVKDIKYEAVEPSQMDDSIKRGKRITDGKLVMRTKKNNQLENSVRKTRNAIKLEATDMDKVSKIVTKGTVGSKETESFTEVINITSKAKILKGNKSKENRSKTRKANKFEETKTDVKSSKSDIDVTKTKNETINVLQDTGSHKTRTAKRFGNKSSAVKDIFEPQVQDYEIKDNLQFENDIDGIVEKKIANKQKILKNGMDSVETINRKKTKRDMKTTTESTKVSEEMQNLKKSIASNNTPDADEISELERYKMSKTESGAAIEQNPKLVIEQNSKLVELENETKENEGIKIIESSIDSTENENLKRGSRKNRKKITLGKSQKNRNEQEINIENYCETNKNLDEKEAVLVNEEARQKSPKRDESEHYDKNKNVQEIKTEFVEKIPKNKLNQDKIKHHMEAALIITNDISNHMDVENHLEENKDNSNEDVNINVTEVKQKILEMKNSAGILCQTNIETKVPKNFKSDCELEINEIHELKCEEMEFGTDVICKISIESTSKINKIAEDLKDADVENSEKFLCQDEFSEKHIDRNSNEQKQEVGERSPEKTLKLTDVEVNDFVSNTDMKKIKKDYKSIGKKNSMEITGIINVTENLETIKGTNNSEEYSKTKFESFDTKSNSWKHSERQYALGDVSGTDLNTNDIQNSCCLVDATFQRENCEIEENSDVLNDEVVDKNVFAKDTEIQAEIKELEYKDSSKYNKQNSNTTRAEVVNESSSSRTVEICCTDIETKKFETLKYIVKGVKCNERLKPVKTYSGNIDISQINLQNSETMNELEVEVQNSEAVDVVEVEVQNSEVRELEVEVRNSEALCELQNSEVEVELQDSEVEVEVQNSEALCELQNSEVEVEVQNSEVEVELQDSEAEVETRNSKALCELRNSEAEIELQDSEVGVETRNSKALCELQNLEAEVELQDSEVGVELQDSEAEVEVQNSEAEVEVQNSDAEAQVWNTEAKVEMQNTEAEVEMEIRTEVKVKFRGKGLKCRTGREFETNKSGNIQNNLNCSYVAINILSNKEKKTLTGGTSSKSKENIELDVEDVTNFREEKKMFQSRMESVEIEMKRLNVALKTQEEKKFESEVLKQFLPDCEVKNENSKNMSKVEYHSTKRIIDQSYDLENESCNSSSRIRNALGISNNLFSKKIESNKEYAFKNKTIKSCNDNEPKKIFLTKIHENGQLTGKNSLQYDKPLEETLFTYEKLLEENSNSSKQLSETFDDCNEYLEIMPCNDYKDATSDNQGKSVEVIKEISVQDFTEVKDYDNENCLQIKNVNDNEHISKTSACCTKQLNIFAGIDEHKQVNVINRIKHLDEPSNDRDLSKETFVYSKEQILGTFQNSGKQLKENISNDNHELIENSFDKKKVLNVTNSEDIQLLMR
ncbi:uncharacterized protein TNIN_102081 [Trichonephila inaurata madagascariensis]|uniref:Uncharacterized protein n=1 Tax=Trichonephila inaurata madagascariensis TaxID=2747483 RepID=A0A8X7CQ10_9ARAC|nr:uncharacterized protein TNIN_102081 [Trichonephila inaurata madagascariensis]